jgi:hypothetical protein
MSLRVEIFGQGQGRRYGASLSHFLRSGRPDVTFGAWVTDAREQAELAYFDRCQIAAFRVAYDSEDQHLLGRWDDSRFEVIISEARALPFALLATGGIGSVFWLPGSGPAAHQMAPYPLRPRWGHQLDRPGPWNEWLPTVPHLVTESADHERAAIIHVNCGSMTSEELISVLRADARAAFQRIKEADSGR